MAEKRTRRVNTRAYNESSYGQNQKKRSEFTKKSGCTIHTMDTSSKEPNIFITGWKVSNGDMLSMKATTYKNSKVRQSDSPKSKGLTWVNLFVTITNKTKMSETKSSGLFCIDTKKLYIKEFNLIANPRAPRGGYFGKHISSSY
jgi:hypothetical protein